MSNEDFLREAGRVKELEDMGLDNFVDKAGRPFRVIYLFVTDQWSVRGNWCNSSDFRFSEFHKVVEIAKLIRDSAS